MKKYHILIIDDDKDFRTMLKYMLYDENYLVTEVDDGKDAINSIYNDYIDLIITDIIMPEKDGLEVIQYFRKSMPNVKIIAMSGGGRIGAGTYLEIAKEMGADHIISKPFEYKPFLSLVQKLISDSNSNNSKSP